MEKRVFLAIFLSFIVLAVYQSYFAPPPTAPVADSAQAPATAAVPAPAAGPATAATPPPVESAPAAAVRIGDTEARDVVVETDAIEAVFSTRGASLKSWRLRHYVNPQGDLVDLVPQDLPAGTFDQPFTIVTEDAKESAALAGALFRPSVTSLSLGSTTGTLSFEYEDETGLRAIKTFEFQPNGQEYLVKVQATVTANQVARPLTLKWGPGIGLGYSPDGSRHSPVRAVQFRDNSMERFAANKLQTQPRYQGAVAFAGVDDHYFVCAIIPATGATSLEYQPVSLPVPGAAQNVTRAFVSFSVTPAPSPSGGIDTTFFMGPKDFDKLRAAQPQLVRAIDFGMFAPIVVPLLQALKWVNRFLGNYGWSIVVLTILINILIFPLRHRSMVSMRKMQALQPEVKSIQDRYAKYKVTDPERQKMNQEMMALYKQKGVNPASGCVPMLLTMPILLAFYSLLNVAIELRGAPFVGWIHDLAAKDPYYVWPLLMGATMFWQQRMMPSTADPVQQKIFLLMPVIFTVMFLNVPSGLVIYWLTSNLLTIGQQYITNRMIGSPAPALAGRPSGKR